MPEEARLQREDPDLPPWGWAEELLAQAIEEVSILAADKRRKEPRQVKRPFSSSTEPSAPSGLVHHESGRVTAHGHDAMLAMFAARVAVPASPGATDE